MKNFELNSNLMAALSEQNLKVDELGRIIIDDEKLLNMINGAFSNGFAEMPNPLWNGACSNQRC